MTSYIQPVSIDGTPNHGLPGVNQSIDQLRKVETSVWLDVVEHLGLIDIDAHRGPINRLRLLQVSGDHVVRTGLDHTQINLDLPLVSGDGQHGPLFAVALDQPGSNRKAVGARISVKTGNRIMDRTIAIGGGHASGQLGFVHIGLGTAERASIRIKWPDGEWSHAYRAFANHFVRIERGAPAADYWLPPPGDDAAK